MIHEPCRGSKLVEVSGRMNFGTLRFTGPFHEHFARIKGTSTHICKVVCQACEEGPTKMKSPRSLYKWVILLFWNSIFYHVCSTYLSFLAIWKDCVICFARLSVYQNLLSINLFIITMLNLYHLRERMWTLFEYNVHCTHYSKLLNKTKCSGLVKAKSDWRQVGFCPSFKPGQTSPLQIILIPIINIWII